MAIETTNEGVNVLILNNQEATDLIGLLVAQLANVALVNNAGGACPTINVVDGGVIKYRLTFCIAPRKE